MNVENEPHFGALAPNEPLRTALTALAPGATTAPPAPNQEPATESAHPRAARYAWALLLVRIDEVFPLVCPDCGGAMKLIAFITDAPTVRDILDHLGESTMPPRAPLDTCELDTVAEFVHHTAFSDTPTYVERFYNCQSSNSGPAI